MSKLIDPQRVYKFKLSSDKDDPGAMVFHIKPMTYRASLDIADAIRFNRDRTMSTNLAESSLDTFQKHVAKIENVFFPGVKGILTIETDEDKEKLFSCLSKADGEEILAAIQNQSILEEREIKN